MAVQIFISSRRLASKSSSVLPCAVLLPLCVALRVRKHSKRLYKQSFLFIQSFQLHLERAVTCTGIECSCTHEIVKPSELLKDDYFIYFLFNCNEQLPDSSLVQHFICLMWIIMADFKMLQVHKKFRQRHINKSDYSVLRISCNSN